MSLSIQRVDDLVEAQEVADQRQMFAVPREFRLRECTDHDVAEFGDVAHVNDALLRIERQRPTHGPIRLLLRSHYAEQILIEERRDHECVVRESSLLHDALALCFVAYLTDVADPPVFRHVPSPGKAELHALVRHIAERIGRMLEKHGLIERDVENAWLSDELAPAGSLDDLIGHSITYRIAVGPRAGQKVFTLQTVPAQGEGEGRNGAAQAGGFSLHAGLDIETAQRAKLETAVCVQPSRRPGAARVESTQRRAPSSRQCHPMWA